MVNTLFKLNDEIKNSKFPATSVLHSLLAECYFHYYQRNRGRFYNRTQVPNIDFSDIQTWDLRTIVEKMTAEFELSLQNPEALKKTPFNVFSEMISDSGAYLKLRPTLFDFLAHRAINYFSMDDNTLLKPASEFTLNSEAYFEAFNKFPKIKLRKTPQSLKFHALKLLQDLIIFHAKQFIR